MATIAPSAVGTAGFDFHPDLKTLDVEYVVTLSWKALEAFVFLKITQADVAFLIAQVLESFKENDGVNLAEVLIVVCPSRFQLWWQCLVVVSYDSCFVLEVVCDTFLHEVDAIFV